MKTKLQLCFTILFLSATLVFSQWTQIGADIDGEVAHDESGFSVSLSSDGSRVAIGARYNNGNGWEAGHVRIYQLDGVNWNQLGSDIDGEAANDQSGISVSLNSDGSIVAIGAYLNDGSESNSGHVRIYQFDGASWVQIGSDIDGEAWSDQSGVSVSLNSDGDIVAIGAPFNDGNGFNSGHVRVYELQGGNWVQLGSDIDGEAANDRFGYSVSLNSDGTIVAIGAIHNDGNGVNSGHVRVCQFNGVNWNQLGSDIDGEAGSDQSGVSVSLSDQGIRVAIGAYLNDGNGSNSGHVRVYELQGGNWLQVGTDIDGEASSDWFGNSVSLSSNGSLVAIGAPLNNDNGIDSGHVRIYQWNEANWVQFGSDIDGQAAGDFSGWSVSLSSDGGQVAIGAYLNDGNGNNSGHVRIYDDNYTFTPDPNFEQALIDQGMDSEGILNGYVPTSDISGVTDLIIPNLNISDLTGIQDFTALQTLICNNNNLSYVDLSNNNNLTTLNISNIRSLVFLDCSENSLTSLDVTNSHNLQELRCNGNQLTGIDIIDIGSLEVLYCNDNQLTALDVSENPDLQVLHCYNNQLSGSLNLSELSELQDFNATNNPGLVCIEVQQPEVVDAGEDAYANWFKDPGAVYSADCGGMMAKGETTSDIKNTEHNSEEGDNNTAKNIVVHPNPAAGDQLYITLPDGWELSNVILYNVQGEKVAEARSTHISAAGLTDGVYFVKIQRSDGENITKKVLIYRE